MRLIDLLTNFGIQEMVRTGRVALLRGYRGQARQALHRRVEGQRQWQPRTKPSASAPAACRSMTLPIDSIDQLWQLIN